MAVTNAWTSTISPSKLPAGATIPSVDELEGVVNKENFTIDLDAATYDNATETTAWTAIADAVKAAIDANWVSDVFGIDAALTVTMRTVITGVERRFDNFELGDYPNQYTAAADIFRVTGFVEWLVS